MYKRIYISCLLLSVVFFSVYTTSCNKIEVSNENTTVLHPFQIVNISQSDTLLVHQGIAHLSVRRKDKIKIDFLANYQNSGYNWSFKIVLPDDEVITEIPYEFQIDNKEKYVGLINITATGLKNGNIVVQSVKLEIRLVE